MATETLIPSHGGYRDLRAFQSATLVYDLTVEFCEQYRSHQTYRTHLTHRMIDQMVQAARSGRQNIAEGSQASGTSKKTELKLMNVARASLEELLLDYEDFLRQRQLPLWPKDSEQSLEIRALVRDRSHTSYESYVTYLDAPESAANMLIVLIHQTNYLLDQLLRSLEQDFLSEGGFTERLYRLRSKRS